MNMILVSSREWKRMHEWNEVYIFHFTRWKTRHFHSKKNDYPLFIMYMAFDQNIIY